MLLMVPNPLNRSGRTFQASLVNLVLLLLVRLQVAYHAKEIPGIASTFANPVVQVGANIGSVMDVIKARFPSA